MIKNNVIENDKQLQVTRWDIPAHQMHYSHRAPGQEIRKTTKYFTAKLSSITERKLNRVKMCLMNEGPQMVEKVVHFSVK